MKRWLLKLMACVAMIALLFNSINVQAMEDSEEDTEYTDTEDADYSDSEEEDSSDDEYSEEGDASDYEDSDDSGDSEDSEDEDASSDNENEITNEAVINYCNEYDELSDGEVSSIYFSEEDNDTTMPLKIRSSGLLIINIEETSKDYYTLETNLYRDKAGKDSIATINMLRGSSKVSKQIYISKPGTYYLNQRLTNGVEELQFDLQLNFIEDIERSITTGKVYAVYQSKEQSSDFFKIHMGLNKLVKITVKPDNSSEYTASFTIYDRKKNKILDVQKDSVSGANKSITTSYYLDEGDYYLEVNTNGGLYALSYTASDVKDQSGKSAKKSALIKVGSEKLTTGYFLRAESTLKEDWFQFDITKKKDVSIAINWIKSGKFGIELLDKDEKLVRKGIVDSGQSSIKLSWKGIPKGTYYLRLYKMNSKSTGSYSFTVK